ncbi:hypothetical protein UFOVP1613_18 [uncultured Caudovirales phage]|uniref:Uncharacterized protein n=1 Tax=uncultured Caudovirales phage TaxID=2100421 RepID=A0A6J5QS61_9CAUD|nr:hypothetical protein UFOVP1163_20 [uncultured Caudovirales phage]CAB4219267.1 hypothetical protein UFOVP1613_18 [uncultured Caudovirales phage]
MAVFNKNTLTQVSGFDNPIIAGELVYEQQTFWNLALTAEDNTTPVDLTGATIDAQIVRRMLSNVKDTRYGLSFDIANYTPTPTAIPMTITNRDDAAGTFTLVIDDNSWGLVDSDTQMDIASVNGAGFSGRIKISFPSIGSNPAEDNIIFLLFIVRSDGIVKI